MKKLIIHSQSHLRIIAHDDILFCKSDNCYTSVHLANGESFVVCKSLSAVAKEMDTASFLRINQSYLVNMHHIKLIDKKKKHVELCNEHQIPFTTSLKDLLNLFGGGNEDSTS